MTAGKTRREDERKRHAEQIARLEALLRDPGPGITVRRVGAEDGEQRPAEAVPAPAPKPAAAAVENAPVRARREAAQRTPTSHRSPASQTAPAVEPTPAPAAAEAGMQHMPAGAVDRLNVFLAGDKSRPTPVSARTAAQPATASGPGDAIRQKFRRAGLFGMLLDWALPSDGPLKTAIADSRAAFVATGQFSLVINILMLAGPLFMLQVYDRVMTSGSMPTLIALSAMTAAMYAIIGVLEYIRARVIVRIGTEVDQRISDRVFHATLRRSLSSGGSQSAAMRELDSLRTFIGGPGPGALFDAPWTPIYLAVVFMLHWTLGLAATAGALMLLALAWMSEVRSRAPLQEAGKATALSIEMAETGQRNAESLTAMGMVGAYRDRWQQANGEALAWQLLTADRLGGMSAVSKTLRLLLQSVMLAIGAALALKGDISAGSIVAATIIFGRALAPVEQAIGHWRSFVKARESYEKLAQLLNADPVPQARTALPAPTGKLEVAGLRVAAPDTRSLILSGIAFAVEPGQMLAVIGPSASGKSTLARTIVGLWPPFSGSIRLDGARLDQWDPEALGRHIGYLPQNVELFAGTVRDNISRFRADARDEDVVAAATMAHAHDMILALPNGYDTQLGNFGTYLSAGQRQRIGLARALYGNPALVVLDEPNSNLDRIGDEALSSAIDGMRARGQSIVLVSHRVQAIGKADRLLYIDRGTQRAFGPRAEVLKLFQNQAAQTAGGDDGADRRGTDRRQTDRRQGDRRGDTVPTGSGAP